MKKLVGIVILSLLFSNITFSKTKFSEVKKALKDIKGLSNGKE